MINGLTDCKYLEELEIFGGQLQLSGTINFSCNDNNNTLVNLKQLALNAISIDLSLFRSLLQLNMSKLERLILNDIDITIDSKTIDNNVKVDIDPNFINVKHLTLGKSNGNWHHSLLNNLDEKNKKLSNISGSKLESIELSVCQMTAKTAAASKTENSNNDTNNDNAHSSVNCNYGTRYVRIKKVIIILNSPNEAAGNVENIICRVLARVGNLTKSKINDRNELFTYSSDIETLGIAYDARYGEFDIIDSFEILSKIKFTKLKSLLCYIERYCNYRCCHLEFNSHFFDDLLHRINTIDQFFSINSFICIHIKYPDDYYLYFGKSDHILYSHYVSFGSEDKYKQPREIDKILNKKAYWDQFANIVSKWCNYNNKSNIATHKHVSKDKDGNDNNEYNLGLKLQFCTCINLGGDVKVNGSTLCEKVKWINTMINSLSMCSDTIDFGDMITKNSSLVDKNKYNTESKFDIQLNDYIVINGNIQEKNQYCCFDMTVVIQLV